MRYFCGLELFIICRCDDLCAFVVLDYLKLNVIHHLLLIDAHVYSAPTLKGRYINIQLFLCSFNAQSRTHLYYNALLHP